MNKRQFKKLSEKTVTNETLIPKQTPYCYKVDRDSIKMSKTIEDIPTIACPYYYVGEYNQYGCLKTGFFGESIALKDMVKICDK